MRGGGLEILLITRVNDVYILLITLPKRDKNIFIAWENSGEAENLELINRKEWALFFILALFGCFFFLVLCFYFFVFVFSALSFCLNRFVRCHISGI